MRIQARILLSSAAAIGFVGVIIAVTGAPNAEANSQHTLGLIAVLFSALTFAVSMVLMRARALADGPIIVSFMASLIPGLIVAGPAIALSPPPHLADWAPTVAAIVGAVMPTAEGRSLAG